MEDKKIAKALAKLKQLGGEMSEFSSLIETYRQDFLKDDGEIDSVEQKELDKLDKKINKISLKIAKKEAKLTGSVAPSKASILHQRKKEEVKRLKNKLESLLLVYGLV